jgi:tRNA G18 (ribose-2'-O)-methylase SpoU
MPFRTRSKYKSGYFGIGIYQAKTEHNIGTLFRSALVFGADFIFVIGKRYKVQSSDTYKTTTHLPFYEYLTFEDFYKNMPKGAQLVGIEITDNAREIKNYCHPKQAIYLLGAEDSGIPNTILDRCVDIVKLPGKQCLNVSTAGSIVLFDRVNKR